MVRAGSHSSARHHKFGDAEIFVFGDFVTDDFKAIVFEGAQHRVGFPTFGPVPPPDNRQAHHMDEEAKVVNALDHDIV